MINQFRDVDMHLLLVFQGLCQTGSVTKTAENMRLSQGAISHSLRKLRDLFGDPLFVRSQSGLVKTRKAEEITEAILQIIEIGQSLFSEQAGFDPPSADRTINLCVSDVGEVAILPTLLNRVALEAPNCRVNVEPFDPHRLPELVDTAQIDLLISGQQPRIASLRQQKLYRHDYAVLAHPQSDLPDVIDLETYCGLDHLSASTARNGRSIVDQWLYERGLRRRVILTTPHVLVLPYVLQQAPELVATVPSFFTDRLVAEGRFRRVDVAGEFLELDIFQFWPDRFHHDRFSRWLRDVVRGCFMHHQELNI